jgi:hypothetical protein
VERAVESLRQVIVDIASSADRQLRLFEMPNSTIYGLRRRLERTFTETELWQAGTLSSLERQALDELYYEITEANPAMHDDLGHCYTDEFLRNSEFWRDVRDQAHETLVLLGWSQKA